MANIKTKEVINKIKKKWFIYFLILALVVLAWGLYYGRIVETPADKVCYVWVTQAKIDKTSNEQENEKRQSALDKSNKTVDKIMQAFEENYSEYGFKKYKTQMQSLSNNDELFTYNMFNQHDGDISILPISYFTNNNSEEELEKFTQLKDLGKYDLSQSGARVSYIKGLDYNGKEIKVAIKINEHYALAVSNNVSAPDGAIEKLLELVLDII